ncbi:MAG: TerB family tellurite resistance protein [Rhodobacteraceae bacterium]|jgi:uncharacterized tellurite resistance protein B-like protein|nr:TerB family tellurite resistance protein [Paracoccaceae bacterium]
MFDALLRRLTAPDRTPLPTPDARLALAALMVRVARADDSYTQAEATRIDRVLAALHAMSPFEAAKLRREAEELEGQAPDTVRFTRAIKDHVAIEDRDAVMEALWDVALADGTRDAEEDTLMRLVANLLGITDRDSALARQRVEARRPAG